MDSEQQVCLQAAEDLDVLCKKNKQKKYCFPLCVCSEVERFVLGGGDFLVSDRAKREPFVSTSRELNRAEFK